MPAPAGPRPARRQTGVAPRGAPAQQGQWRPNARPAPRFRFDLRDSNDRTRFLQLFGFSTGPGSALCKFAWSNCCRLPPPARPSEAEFGAIWEHVVRSANNQLRPGVILTPIEKYIESITVSYASNLSFIIQQKNDLLLQLGLQASQDAEEVEDPGMEAGAPVEEVQPGQQDHVDLPDENPFDKE